jgi:hypothetical protein
LILTQCRDKGEQIPAFSNTQFVIENCDVCQSK